MAINTVLSRELNWHRRACLGCVGTTMPRFSNEALAGLTSEERFIFTGIVHNARNLSEAAKAQAKAVEDFYLKYGSATAKLTIAKRRELHERLFDPISGTDMTDREWDILNGKKNVYPKKERSKPQETSQKPQGAVKNSKE